MAGRVTAWLISTDLRTGPGGRVSLGPLVKDRQPWRYPVECPSLGMAVHIEAEPGPHELGFALTFGEEAVAAPLIVSVDVPTGTGWVFLDRGPHALPGPGTYYVDVSLDGEIAESGQFALVEMPAPKVDVAKYREAARRRRAEREAKEKGAAPSAEAPAGGAAQLPTAD